MAYDVMGRQIQTSDAAGVTAFAYDAFSSLTNETVAGQFAKSLDRHVDGYGRNVGYSLDGQRKQTVAYDPATGRVATMDGFAWQYLPGTDLKQSLAYPDGTVAEWVYEPRRDLLTLVSNDVFSAYAYENDAAGRRISKNTERYGYNVRGELIAATNTAPVAHYAYIFDDIGNRVVADELGTNIAYTANALNQYTNIVSTDEFLPAFDDDGNQTLVKTSTGIWNVTYNAENRPAVWSNGTAVVTMDFDRMGRRVWYASVSGGVTNAFSKFVYNGYLCVQQLGGFTDEVEQEFVWDPTETDATRPLKWTLPGLGRTFLYFHDGNKNVSDAIDASDGSLAAHYDYAPFGAVTVATGPMADANPYRFSSEYHDPALGCIYYNYRHYNPLDGRWTSRDRIGERGGLNVFGFVGGSLPSKIDLLGLKGNPVVGGDGTEYRDPNWGSLLPCCGGVPYDSAFACCIDGVTTAKTPIDTEISKVVLKGREDPWLGLTWGDSLTEHAWIAFPLRLNPNICPADYKMKPDDIGGVGFYPGEFNSPYWPHPGNILWPIDCRQIKKGHPLREEDPVRLSPCEYDLDKFVRCVTAKPSGTPRETCKEYYKTNLSYGAGLYDCRHFQRDLISVCMGVSKR
jgi:RHS repeat-associated protein